MQIQKQHIFRKLIHTLHLWLGLLSSCVLFVVCLTGTIYTFKSEIQQWLDPEMYTLSLVKDEVISIDELSAYIVSQYGGEIQRVRIEQRKDKPYVFTVGGDKYGKRGMAVYVNPYTKEVVGSGSGPVADFFSTVQKLHRWLLLDVEVGRPIVGVSVIIFVFLSGSGLVLWFPKKLKSWKCIKPGLKIKITRNWKRVVYDLHKTLGFYTLLIALIIALTGLCWSFDWYRSGLSTVLGAKVFGTRTEVKPQSVAHEGNIVPLSTVINLADETLAYPYRYMTITYPKDESGTFEINKNQASRYNETVTDRLFVDQYSGEVIKLELYGEMSLGWKLANSIHALHFGTIYGGFSKVIYFIVCLIVTSLPVTGTLIWLNKRKKSSGRKV